MRWSTPRGYQASGEPVSAADFPVVPTGPAQGARPRVHVSLGPVVIARIDAQVDATQVQAMADLLREHYPGHEVVVLAATDTDVLTPVVHGRT